MKWKYKMCNFPRKFTRWSNTDWA